MLIRLNGVVVKFPEKYLTFLTSQPQKFLSISKTQPARARRLFIYLLIPCEGNEFLRMSIISTDR